jgi:hypothetical protein
MLARHGTNGSARMSTLPTLGSGRPPTLRRSLGRSGARLRQAYGAAGSRPTNLQGLSLRSLQPKLRLRLRKAVDRELEVIRRMSRRNLSPDTRGALRYHWVKESDHIQPKF